MSRKKERFSNIEEFNLSAFSRGISPGELAKETGISWKGRSVVLTEDGIFHFFLDGREIDPPGSLADISEISREICDETTEKVIIPSGVMSIGSSAFYGCIGLTSVTIPDSVKNIGNWAFYNCKGLTSVTIGNNVTSIGAGAFKGCSGLMGVTIPVRVTRIGYEAFSSCLNLTSVTIPDSVTSILDWAFRNCTGLKSITIPRRFENNLEKIGIYRDKTKVSFSG